MYATAVNYVRGILILMVISPAAPHWKTVYEKLSDLYPDAACSLIYSNAFELLVATVLSAQTTDARVNTITPALFRAYPTPRSLAGAKEEDVRALVRPLGFQVRRASQLIRLSQALLSDHGGKVPAERKLLMKLPGVGRKTANVVLGNVFDTPALTVDTHVGRLSRRLGFTDQKDPLRAERDLAQVFPQETWTKLCHLLIFHGRNICHAKTPECVRCPLSSVCPAAES